MQVEGRQNSLLPSARWPVFVPKAAFALACLLLASAGVCWVAANWEHATSLQKLAGAQALLTVLVLLAIWRTPGQRSGHNLSAQALLSGLAAVATGALLALVGQIYQTGADPWQLFLLWAVLLLPWLLALRTVILGLLVAFLVNIGLARYLGVSGTWLWLDSVGWHGVALFMALVNLALLGAAEASLRHFRDNWRAGPRALGMALAGWLVAAGASGGSLANAASIAPGLLVSLAGYWVYARWRRDLAMVTLAMCTAFFLVAFFLVVRIESEAALLLVIIALFALLVVMLHHLRRLHQALAAQADHGVAQADDAATDGGLVPHTADPWFMSLFRIAAMGLLATLLIALLFVFSIIDIEQAWMAGVVLSLVGAGCYRVAEGDVLRELGMVLAVAGLLMVAGGQYELGYFAPGSRAVGLVLLGVVLYGLLPNHAFRLVAAVIVVGVAGLLTWPGEAWLDLLDFPSSPAASSSVHAYTLAWMPAYLRAWLAAVGAVLALGAAARSEATERRWLPLGWALALLAQLAAWFAPAPGLIGLVSLPLPWQATFGLWLVWLGCAALPVVALAAVLWRVPGAKHMRVLAPLMLAVASIGWMGAPGVAMALLWVILGSAQRRAALLVFGVLALLGYLAGFYYQFESTLLQKSALLGLTGAWLLFSGWLLARGAPPAPESGLHAGGDVSGKPAPLSQAPTHPAPGWRRAGLLAGLVLMLAVANTLIIQKEQILAHGERVVLELAPVDPRSLMQGDYMALRFEVADELGRRLRAGPAHDSQVALAIARRGGYMQLRPDADGVFRLVGMAASADEAAQSGDVSDADVPGRTIVLAYRITPTGDVQIGTDAWFFPEGQASRYERAKYGEFRVSRQGTGILLRMLDEQRQPLP